MELRIFRPAFKEVNERTIQMSQFLLQSHAGNFVKPYGFWLLFSYRQLGRQILVIEAFAFVVVNVRFRLQCPNVDIANTPEGSGK